MSKRNRILAVLMILVMLFTSSVQAAPRWRPEGKAGQAIQDLMYMRIFRSTGFYDDALFSMYVKLTGKEDKRTKEAMNDGKYYCISKYEYYPVVLRILGYQEDFKYINEAQTEKLMKSLGLKVFEDRELELEDVAEDIIKMLHMKIKGTNTTVLERAILQGNISVRDVIESQSVDLGKCILKEKSSEKVVLKDKAIETAVRDRLEIGGRALTRGDLINVIDINSYQFNNEEPVKSLEDLKYMPFLEYGYFSDAALKSLKGLEYAKNLKDLEISNFHLKDQTIDIDFTNFKYLKNLESLSLSNIRINEKQLESINNLRNLKQLWLTNNYIQGDLKEVFGMKNLEAVNISNVESWDKLKISSEKGAMALKKLWIIGYELDEGAIDAIAKCANLEMLELNANKVKDVKEFSKLKKLEELNIMNNEIESIDFVKELVNLYELNLPSNKIKNIEPLRGHKKLIILNVMSNKIKDIKPALTIPNLNQIRINGNDFDKNQLAMNKELLKRFNLEKLVEDDYDEIQFKDENLKKYMRKVTGRSRLVRKDVRNIEYLKLDNMEISDVSGLEFFENLKYLDLRGNNIKDITPLKGLGNLKFLMLEGNKINNPNDLVYVVAGTLVNDVKLQYKKIPQEIKVQKFTEEVHQAIKQFAINKYLNMNKEAHEIKFNTTDKALKILIKLEAGGVMCALNGIDDYGVNLLTSEKKDGIEIDISFTKREDGFRREYKKSLKRYYNDKKIDFLEIEEKDQKDRELIKSKALEITKGAGTNYEKIKRVNDWVYTNIKYDYDILEGRKEHKDQDAVNTLNNKLAVCEGKSNLAASMLRAIGIPCAKPAGQYRNRSCGWTEEVLGFDLLAQDDGAYVFNHGWNRAWDGEKSVSFDPTIAKDYEYGENTLLKVDTFDIEPNKTYYEWVSDDFIEYVKYNRVTLNQRQQEVIKDIAREFSDNEGITPIEIEITSLIAYNLDNEYSLKHYVYVEGKNNEHVMLEVIIDKDGKLLIQSSEIYKELFVPSIMIERFIRIHNLKQ